MDLFKRYLLELCNKIPLGVYVFLLLIFIISALIIVGSKKISDKKRKIASVLFFEYFTILYCATVFFREVINKQTFSTRPFWSYVALYYGERHPDVLFPQMIMNIVIFIPLGFLQSVAFGPTKWWITLIAGISLSLSIEFLQLLTCRGIAEFDDVMHNTIGYLVGYGMYKLVQVTWSRVYGR